MHNKNITIHIGMPKSASTFLQLNIFNNLEDTYFAKHDELIKLMQKISLKNPSTIDCEFEKKKIESFVNTIDENNIIISDERLVGDMFDSFYSFESTISLLYNIFPDAKIIFITRLQDSIVESIYKQYLHEGHSKTYSGFYKNHIDLDTLNYAIYAKKLCSLWNKKHVLVLPFEEFKGDKVSFLKKVTNFLNVKPLESFNKIFGNNNKSYSLISTYVALLFNRFLYREYNNCGFIIEKPFFEFFKQNSHNKVYKTLASISARMSLRWLLQNVIDRVFYIKYSPMSKDEKVKIRSYFKESNKELDEYSTSSLKDYKYY